MKEEWKSKKERKAPGRSEEEKMCSHILEARSA